VLPTLFVVSSLLLGQANPAAETKADATSPSAAAPAAAGKLSPAALATKVKALITQLDSNQQAKREAAEKELVELGPEVLPLLPPVSARTPAEVRNRILRIRTALMQIAIEATTKPAKVTLSGEMKLSEALAKISEQTGNRFVDYRERFNQEPTDPTVKLEIADKSFWEALDEVLDAAGMTIYNYDEDASALAYTARDSGALKRSGRAAYGGLFRLEPSRIDASRNLKMEGRSLRITTDVSWEPRIRPIVLEQPLGEVKAVDENGNEIAVDGSEGNLEVPVEGTNAAVELEIPLMAPERSVTQIASLKGKLTAVVLGRTEAFEFENLDKAKNVEQERGGVVVTLEQFRKNGEIFDAQIQVRFDKAANALESHRGWIYNNECYLVGPKGQRIENAGLEATLLDVNEVGLVYRFDVPDATTMQGYRFVYSTPAAIIKVPVEFELKSIDLP
jgi:hypothetical protein